MSVMGIYDADFMNYHHVIPNLECAKLCTYFHNNKEIAVFTPNLEPEKFTHFYIRKDYDDGVYPSEYFNSNCTYGGRAFSPEAYQPLERVIEHTIPNMHLYDNFVRKYGEKRREIRQIKRILNCAHVRLSEDGQHPKSLQQLNRILQTGRYTGIIFHDYDLGKIENAHSIIRELSETRKYREKDELRPFPIGNKFPLQVDSPDIAREWLKVCIMPDIFFFQYNGLMPNDLLVDICEENLRLARQVYYNVSYGCTSEDDFVMNRLPEIFKQVLFLRKVHIKFLLIYDKNLITTPEVQNFIELINCWLSFRLQEGYLARTQTLYKFCSQYNNFCYEDWCFRVVTLSIDKIREVFQYFGHKHYELFKMFYEWDVVDYEGGEFLDGWRNY